MSRRPFPARRRRLPVFPNVVPLGQRGRKTFRVPLALIMAVAFAGTIAALQFPSGVRQLANSGLQQSEANWTMAAPAERRAQAAGTDGLSARFALCHSGGGTNCVVDGDTFWFAGDKIRIMDIDTPETHPARCASEQALGDQATDRLRDWLNAGPFSLESGDRDSDRYGRQLRIVTRDGKSVGDVLIAEGLARPWEGSRRPWC